MAVTSRFALLRYWRKTCLYPTFQLVVWSLCSIKLTFKKLNFPHEHKAILQTTQLLVQVLLFFLRQRVKCKSEWNQGVMSYDSKRLWSFGLIITSVWLCTFIITCARQVHQRVILLSCKDWSKCTAAITCIKRNQKALNNLKYLPLNHFSTLHVPNNRMVHNYFYRTMRW